MTDYEHRLRDYGLTDWQLLVVLADIHRAISQAYEAQRDEVEQLREALDMYRNGYQGACLACEPVGEENQRLLAEAEQLKNELQECRNK
jgi:outer membrane protein TolC